MQDYRETLRRALENRCANNPRYSLRSFARDLKISPARLSDVLNGRYGLSRAAAEQIAKVIGLNAEESEFFCNQVDSQHARSKRQREAALELVSSRSAQYRTLSLDGFHVISDWYHYAILELSLTKDFQSDSEWIARALGISPHVARAAVERLLRLDLLVEKGGVLRAADEFTASPDGIPSEIIRKFHRQILTKALAAIDLQTVEERDLTSMVMAVDSRRLAEAKADIKKFRRSFDAKFGASGAKDRVYCLSIQFFNLQEKSIPSGDENESV